MSNAITELSTRTSVKSMSLLTVTGYTVGEYIKGMSRTVHGDEIAPGRLPRVQEWLAKNGYRYDHSATERGYISTKIDGEIMEYNGRFGEGYIIAKQHPNSTRFYIVDYWVCR